MLVIGLLSLLFSCIVVIFVMFRNYSNHLCDLDNQRVKLEHTVFLLKNSLIDSWSIDGKSFKSDSIYEEDGTKMSLNYFESHAPILIFRFSKIDCSECVIGHISLIKEFVSRIQIEYMIIGDYSNSRNLGLFKRSNAIKSLIYNAERIVENENQTPFLCIYHNGIISDVFFPNDNFPDLTKQYIDEIQKKYYN